MLLACSYPGGCLQTSPELVNVIMKLRAEFTLTENMEQPKWLGHLAPHAKIYIVWADIFNSLKGPKDSSLGDCVKMATGGRAVLEHSGAAPC